MHARVSTGLQTTDGQIDALNAAGCKRVFEELMSGTARIVRSLPPPWNSPTRCRPSCRPARPTGAIHAPASVHRHRSLIDLFRNPLADRR